eukprot:m.419594 g.419594  ORF g.419594 m.419594 type:complete len:582 (+) comp16840_c1_seq26:126-1871(+)
MSAAHCAYGVQCHNPHCTRIHPPGRPPACFAGARCSDPSCTLLHPRPANHRPAPRATPAGGVPCKFGAYCKNAACTFSHPQGAVPVGAGTQRGQVEVCWHGARCTNPRCTRSHLQRPQAAPGNHGHTLAPPQPPAPFAPQQGPAVQHHAVPRQAPPHQGVPPPGRGGWVPPATETPGYRTAKACRFAAECTNVECTFLHPRDRPAVCPAGLRCNAVGCRGLHPGKKAARAAALGLVGAGGTAVDGRWSTAEYPHHRGTATTRPHLALTKRTVAQPTQAPAPKVEPAPCKYGGDCTNPDCTRPHPPDRPAVCELGKVCPDGACPLLHPARPDVCKGGAACTLFECRLTHPGGRPALCDAAAMCKLEDCPRLHPKVVECKAGRDCKNVNCMNKHPEGRPAVCREAGSCPFSNCEMLHPSRPAACFHGAKCKFKATGGCNYLHAQSSAERREHQLREHTKRRAADRRQRDAQLERERQAAEAEALEVTKSWPRNGVKWKSSDKRPRCAKSVGFGSSVSTAMRPTLATSALTNATRWIVSRASTCTFFAMAALTATSRLEPRQTTVSRPEPRWSAPTPAAPIRSQ